MTLDIPPTVRQNSSCLVFICTLAIPNILNLFRLENVRLRGKITTSLVVAFNIPGIRCWFYSNDHDPPHFHAKKDGDWEFRVLFRERQDAMLEAVWQRSAMSAATRKKLLRLTVKHRAKLLEEWERIHG